MQASVGALEEGLYDALRRTARGVRMGHRVGDTLQTTALIHEAWLKLTRSNSWQNRAHFLAAAAQAMRQVLIDAARARSAARRGSGQVPLPLEEVGDIGPEDARLDEQLVELGEAMERLAVISPRLMRVVECRFFAGYTELETAEALGITDRTARRDWVKARAWLYRELAGEVPSLPA